MSLSIRWCGSTQSRGRNPWFKGLSQAESEDLLRTLQGYITRPENTVRWRLGDVAFWDNRATQHYAIADYGDQPRRVQRVTVVDGEHFFAHCSTKLYYIVRQAPFAPAHLIDEDITVDFQELTTPSDRVAIMATSELTDNETWTALRPGQLLVFHQGRPLELSP